MDKGHVYNRWGSPAATLIFLPGGLLFWVIFLDGIDDGGGTQLQAW